jgi:hypothetical protein
MNVLKFDPKIVLLPKKPEEPKILSRRPIHIPLFLSNKRVDSTFARRLKLCLDTSLNATVLCITFHDNSSAIHNKVSA